MFLGFLSLFLLVFWFGCKDIPRDNLLDPKNPESYRETVVLLEAFVNTENPYNYNELALEALTALKNIYRNQLVIAEYHRNVPGYPDPLGKTIFETLYEKYVNYFDPATRGVPDIFVNGTIGRIQGASSTTSVVARLDTLIAELVKERNYFTLEPADIQISSSALNATCKIARLGSEAAEEILLKIILLRQVDNQFLQHVVIDFKKSVTIPRIEAGEIVVQKFENIPLTDIPTQIVFSLTSADEFTVYQSIKVDL
ncbi:MAG: hypothetical protein Kow0042_25990 [Calditrichia bacterium]